MTKKPLLSVVMITYGHELYIKKAIEGVLSQKTGFCFEFIIANDCSPDNSDEIIRKTIASAPDHILVKYIHHKRNIGAIKNLKNAFDETTTEYIIFPMLHDIKHSDRPVVHTNVRSNAHSLT